MRYLLGVLLALAACQRTEEERLKREIDAIETHLYLGAKVAMVAETPTPEIEAARKAMQAASSSVTAHDVAKTAVALYQLRGLGKDAFAEGKESKLRPLVPTMFGYAATSTSPFVETNLDHFMLLIAGTALKLHPKNPLPIPNRILLYEAWMTNASQIRVPAMAAWAHSAKAYTYATNTYCTLAQVETDAVASSMTAEVELQMLMGIGRAAAHVPEIAAAIVIMPFVTRALAHGATAMCFMERGEQAKADVEIERFIDLMQTAGIPPEDLAIVRGYLAYRKGDVALTLEHLKRAKTSRHLDDQGRRDLEELIEHLEKDRGAFAEYFDKAFFVQYFARMAWVRLGPIAEKALEDADLLRPVRELFAPLFPTE